MTNECLFFVILLIFGYLRARRANHILKEQMFVTNKRERYFDREIFRGGPSGELHRRA